MVGVSASPTSAGVVSALTVKGLAALGPSDSLRSLWTARPETKTWLVVGEAEECGRHRLVRVADQLPKDHP